MGAWKLLAVPIVVLAFGCEGWRGQGDKPPGDRQHDVLQFGGQPAEAAQPLGDGMGHAPMTQSQPDVVVRATVDEVQLGAGRLVLDAEGGRLKLRARPFELRRLVPGDVGQVAYSAAGEGNWVMPMGEWDVDVSSYGQQTTLTGPIEDLDREAGQMRVRGYRLHVHPYQIAEYAEGQFVATTFVTIDGQNWVARLWLAQAPPLAGS